jgi:hypothetical protein
VLALVTDFSLVSLFSYFTILSNLFGSTVFIVGAVWMWRTDGDREVPPAVRGAAVVYLAFVGIVFNTLRVGADLGGLQPWVNVVHHMILPLAVVIDWLVTPPRTRMRRWPVVVWMAVVATYVAYSLLRRAATGFYAYPFFDPAAVGGYGAIATYCLAMLVAFIVLAFLVRWTGNRSSRRAARAEARSRPV